MPRDPLAVLARLRSVEVLTARRRLAEDLTALSAAQGRVAETGEGIAREAAAATGADYAAWLPRARAARDTAAEDARRRAALVEESVAALGAARAAERAVERLAEQRCAEARREAARRESARLDEAAGMSLRHRTPDGRG
ncbi:flagellar FliJ family protein [Muricoccus radiodurans]|uniref:flagellar FliJ family protein n=1 Tax=Muricoccus radiodurans TaxID=2231721 RepID=UPI003CFB3F52